MSAKDALNEILAEVERRKQVWVELQRVAIDVMRTVQEYAASRDVTDGSWIHTYMHGDDAVIEFEGRSVPNKEPIGIFIDVDGSIATNVAEHNANALHQGYPNLSDDAPAQFQQAAIEALVTQVNQYCDRTEQKES